MTKQSTSIENYNIKCKGCGVYLNNNPAMVGYVKNFTINKTKYCSKCFNTKYYNKFESNDLSYIKNELDHLILDNSLVFIILDSFDLINSLIPSYKNEKNVIYLVNKMDLFPNKSNFINIKQNIINNINNLHYQYQDIYFLSANNHSSIKKINTLIFKNKFKKIIFIGKSNTGKSTLIKKICQLNKVNNSIVDSYFLNTTSGINRIKIKNKDFIDTPGYINENSIINYINYKDIKKIYYQQTIHAKTFQIYENRTFHLENLITINVFPKTNAYITFYTNKNLHIRAKKPNQKLNLDNLNHNINYKQEPQIQIYEPKITIINQKNNLIISGIGIFAFKNLAKIEVIIHKDIAINLLKYPII